MMTPEELKKKLPARWTLREHSGSPYKWWGVYENTHTQCTIHLDTEVVVPVHGFYGHSSRKVKTLAKKLGMDYTEVYSLWLYENDKEYKDEILKLNKKW